MIRKEWGDITMDDKGRIEELDLAAHESKNEKRIRQLERALREIDAEVEEHIDINAAGGPNLAARVANIVSETLGSTR